MSQLLDIDSGKNVGLAPGSSGNSNSSPSALTESIAPPTEDYFYSTGKMPVEENDGIGGVSSSQRQEQPPPPPRPMETSSSSSAVARITVPKRVCQGGFDEKFEVDPYNVNLRGLMTANEYTDAVTILNETIKPARSKKLDAALLATGMLMVPVAVWGVRHGSQQKKRKKLLLKAIADFNGKHPHLYMRWNRRPASVLTIERRREDLHGTAPPPPPGADAAESGAMVPSGAKTQAYFEYQVN